MVFYLSLAIMILGILGIFIPFLPDLPLILIGALIYGYSTSFVTPPVYYYIITCVFILLGFLSEYLTSYILIKKHSSNKNVWIGTFAGTLIGAVFLFPIGMLIGGILGTFAMEYHYTSDTQRAMKSTWYLIIGYLSGNLIKLILGIFLIVLFISSVV